MDEDDVDGLYTTNGRDVWRFVYYCRYPTATLENLETNERIGGAVGSLILKPFIRLMPEREIKEDGLNS